MRGSLQTGLELPSSSSVLGSLAQRGWSTANPGTLVSAAGKLLGLLPCIPLPMEAKARLCPLSQAGLGLFSRPTLPSISQSHMVVVSSCHRLLHNLGGVLGSCLLPLIEFRYHVNMYGLRTFQVAPSHPALWL